MAFVPVVVWVVVPSALAVVAVGVAVVVGCVGVVLPEAPFVASVVVPGACDESVLVVVGAVVAGAGAGAGAVELVTVASPGAGCSAADGALWSVFVGSAAVVSLAWVWSVCGAVAVVSSA